MEHEVIIISVLGGVAEIVECPDHIQENLYIIDWDNLEVGWCPLCNIQLHDEDFTCPNCKTDFSKEFDGSGKNVSERDVVNNYIKNNGVDNGR